MPASASSLGLPWLKAAGTFAFTLMALRNYGGAGMEGVVRNRLVVTVAAMSCDGGGNICRGMESLVVAFAGVDVETRCPVGTSPITEPAGNPSLRSGIRSFASRYCPVEKPAIRWENLVGT